MSSENASDARVFLNNYCVSCHNEKLKTADLLLDKADVAHPAEGGETWEKVIRKLRAGMMPPTTIPKRPDAVTNSKFISYLETSLDQAAAAHPDPGRAPAHRLNRSEYANAIRDLLGLTVDSAVLLPPDDEAYGFDNIADQLKLSPLQLERYMSAAWSISHVAIADPALRPDITTYRMRGDATQRSVMPGLPLGTQGGMTVTHNFPLDGEYEFRLRLWRTAFENAQIRGLDEPRQAEYSIDGVRVFLGNFGGAADTALDEESHALAADSVENRLKFRLHVKAGEHTVTVTFLKKSDSLSQGHDEPFERSNEDVLNANGVAHLDRFSIGGPYDVAKGVTSSDTASREKIFVCRPSGVADQTACARKILTNLARRAFRRPVTDADLEPLLASYRLGLKEGSFDLGIARGLRSLLTAPEFLYRFESDPAGVAPGSINRLSDIDLASRLSFFLWSSIPDDELLNTAAQGKLKDPAVLEREVRRMIADPRSDAFVNNFAGQWLMLRNLRNLAPDPQAFPDFDDNLRQAMQRETELFFGSIMREDRSLTELLTANYTFINDRLARHYGISGVIGSDFQRVTLTDPARFGILGKASTLTVTSYTTRTSPVVRGKWILTQLLGTPPSVPPPNVPTLKENSEGGPKLTVRQRMEEHRANPACASCHKVMDPLGFSLENFNAIGQWRSLGEDGRPVDTAGELVDGTKVDGVVALRNALVSHPDQFAATFCEKLMTYALGRGVDYGDMPTIREIVKNAEKDKFRFSSVILDVVKSELFQMKKAAQTAPVLSASN